MPSLDNGEKLSAYRDREKKYSRDIRWNYISEDVRLSDTDCMRSFFDVLLHARSAADWGERLALMGNQHGNHIILFYMQTHIMPYLTEAVAPKTSFKTSFETMEKLIRLAEKQTTYWNDYWETNELLEIIEHPLYNPHYEAQTKELTEQLDSQFSSRTWSDFCFVVQMYLFALM